MKHQTWSNSSARPDSSDQLSRISRPQLFCSRCYNALPTHALDCGHIGKFSDSLYYIISQIIYNKQTVSIKQTHLYAFIVHLIGIKENLMSMC